MGNTSLDLFIKKCEANFLRFCSIDSFPEYSVVSKELTTAKASTQGFDSLASAFYDISSGSHKLEVWSRIYQPQLNAEYLIFHELTHILDAEAHSQKDKFKHTANKGYTEYHAAQNDFLCLLGATKSSHPFSFSMEQSFETFSGIKTANEFVMMPHSHATEMIERPDFPMNIEALATTLGLIFNYYGRRSICNMYAKDYIDNADNTSIAKLIHTDTVKALNNFMLSWLKKEQIAVVDALCGRMIVSLAQQYHLA